MSFMGNISSKTGFAALAVGTAVMFGSVQADAATIVNQGGGPYDIASDNIFIGEVDAFGGAGSYTVDFTSSIDPLRAFADATVSVGVLGTFSNLIAQWVNTDTSAVLVSEAVAAPLTELNTIFDTSNINQSLVFTWDDSLDGAGFDFDVSAVPLPAAGWLMIAGLGGLAAMRRRKKAA